MQKRNFLKAMFLTFATTIFRPSATKEIKKMENYLFEIARKRRSIRQYGKKPIDKKILDEIMKVAICAPSSFGYKPVEFVLVRDKAMIKKIGECKSLGGSQIEGADTVIVVMVKTENQRAAEFWIEDGAVASAYTLLAIEQFGLGACWVQIRNRSGKRGSSDEEIRALLNVPNGYTVLNLIAVGEKAEYKEPYTEDNLPFKNIHYGSF